MQQLQELVEQLQPLLTDDLQKRMANHVGRLEWAGNGDESFRTLASCLSTLQQFLTPEPSFTLPRRIQRDIFRVLHDLPAKIRSGGANEIKAVAEQAWTLERLLWQYGILGSSDEADQLKRRADELRSAVGDAEQIRRNVAEHEQAALTAAGQIEAQLAVIGEAAEKVREHQKQAEQHLGTIKGVVDNSDSLKGKLNEADAYIREAKEGVGRIVKEIEGDRELSEEALQDLKEALAKVEQSKEALAKYEKDMWELREKIIGLLPGATSAGLAHAFNDQRGRLVVRQRVWGGAFIAAIAILTIFGIWYLASYAGEPSSVLDVFAYMSHRLPFAAPLVWLGWYSARQYNLAARLHEEYAFKETVSRAFEGYKGQMAALSEGHQGEEGDVSPMLTLCNNVLSIISADPGRIYERAVRGHKNGSARAIKAKIEGEQ